MLSSASMKGGSSEPSSVRITRQTVALGKTVKVGQILTLPGKEARFLIHIGKAEPYTPPPEPRGIAKGKECTKCGELFTPRGRQRICNECR